MKNDKLIAKYLGKRKEMDWRFRDALQASPLDEQDSWVLTIISVRWLNMPPHPQVNECDQDNKVVNGINFAAPFLRC